MSARLTNPLASRNPRRASTIRPRRMCHTIAVPPNLAVTTEAITVAASSQGNSRVGKSQTRTRRTPASESIDRVTRDEVGTP